MSGRPLRKVPVHYQRANHTSWSPPSLISFDTETKSVYEGNLEVMKMRLWCARFTDRRAPKKVTPVDDFAHSVFPEDLATQVHKWTRQRRTVWAYAHNLGFDLRTSSLVEHLIDLRWEVTEFAVSTGAPFIRMRYGDCTLTLSDSWSWFGTRLEDMAQAIGMVKPRLPEHDDAAETWLARCTADVDILHTSMLDLMQWWDDSDLGRWNLTGSASGWNAMRHIPTPQRMLIRPDDDECDHDRRAIYGGRRSVWRTGGYQYGRYSEIDLEKAYTTVCRDMPLPAGRQCTFTSLPLDNRWLDCERWGVIAECTITTDHAQVPVRVGNGVWYPVGTFRTTLAGPDIRECRRLGTLKAVGAGWLHQLAYVLRPWAAWCIDSMREDNASVPDIAKLVHKQWARSAVGKYAQRGYEIVELGPSPNAGWNSDDGWHCGKNVPMSIVDFAGTRYQVAAVNQSDNSYPAVLAFVESYVRVALNRAIGVIGPDHMSACDTDGYICDSIGADLTNEANALIAPLHLRVKRHYRRIRVIGPQHMELDSTRRTSGIPGSAVKGRDGKLHARTWPKLAWQLAHGRQGAYVRPEQAYTLAATYAPGWVLSDCSVVPVEMRIGPDGDNAITPYRETRYARDGFALAADQNRHLRRYYDDTDQAGHRAHHQGATA